MICKTNKQISKSTTHNGRFGATHYQNLHLLGWSYKYSGSLIIGCMVVVVEEA